MSSVIEKQEAPLTKKVVRAGAWSLAIRASERLLQLGRTFAMARLLAPGDFGLFAIALLVLSSLDNFSVTGFQQALVQKKDEISPYLDTAWSVSVIRGLLLAVVVICLGPSVGLFFHEPRAVVLVECAGVCLFLRGLTSMGTVYFLRNLTFNKQFLYLMSGTLVDLAVSISLALILRNAWALLGGYLAGALVRVIVSFAITPYRPRFTVDWEKAKEMSRFGRWIFIAGLLTFLLNHGDDLTVGRLLNSTNLGLYRMAYLIASVPTSEIAQLIGEITFSAFARLQDRAESLKAAYLDTIQLVMLITFPITAGLLLVGKEVTFLFLGRQWASMLPAMMVLAVWGFSRSVGATTGALFQAVGRPEIGARLQFGRLLVFAALVVPLTMRFGILGTGWAVVAGGVSFEPIAVYLALRLVRCNYAQLLKLLSVPVVATAVMSLAVRACQFAFGAQISLIGLALAVGTGVIAYFGTLVTVDACSGRYVRDLLRRRYKPFGSGLAMATAASKG